MVIGARKELNLLDTWMFGLDAYPDCLDVGLTLHTQTRAMSISTYAQKPDSVAESGLGFRLVYGLGREGAAHDIGAKRDLGALQEPDAKHAGWQYTEGDATVNLIRGLQGCAATHAEEGFVIE